MKCNKKIRVFQIIDGVSPEHGGTAAFMRDFQTYLPVKKVLSDLIVGKKSKADYKFQREVHSATEMAKLISDDAQIVHIHGVWLRVCNRASALSKKNSGVKCIISPHGMLEPWALEYKKWKKLCSWYLYQRKSLLGATALHACSEQEASNLRQLGLHQPIAVIPNGVQFPELSTDFLNKSEVADRRIKTALFLSRINPKKGLPMLLDAWSRINPTGWRLVIAGNDDSKHLPVVARKIKDLSLQDRVELTGPLFGDAKEAAYRNADLFVLPSYSENFGIVVTEALGYGVPVLTTTGCPWQELVTEQCGWWVDPTLDGIEDGLRRAFDATDFERQRMGERGRDLVQRNYLWPKIADKMYVFYQWLLEGGNAPDFVQLYND